MSGERTAENDALPDTYPECGCQPDDCPDREGVGRSAENGAIREAVARVLSERMDRGTSGRLIADYGVSIHSLATEIARVIPSAVTEPGDNR